MFENVNRISIIGGSGTGKTTLSNNLGKQLNIPVYHIDGIHHLPNWEIRDKNERDTIILELIEKERWIIDGTYRSTLKKRLEKSDLIIYLDYSSIAQVKGVLGRFIKNHNKERPEIPGCKERMSISFLLWVLHWKKNRRTEIIQAMEDIDKEKILIFKNRYKLNKWYKSILIKKLMNNN